MNICLDKVDNLQLSDEEANKHFNELSSLRYLSSGLWVLYNHIQKIETEVTERIPKDKRAFYFGNHPDLEGIPQDFVACAFHWYAVTVCNYVRLVGWLGYSGNPGRAKKYLERVLPEVYLWRNKIGAHFAILDPHNDDNAADLAMSVVSPISFDDDAFYTGSLKLTMSSGGKSSTSRQDMRWSLTQTHRTLSSRYWEALKRDVGNNPQDVPATIRPQQG